MSKKFTVPIVAAAALAFCAPLAGLGPGTTTQQGNVCPHGSLDWEGKGQGHSLYMYYKKKGYFLSEEEQEELRREVLRTPIF